ncbi:DEHA2G12760p [Debaryomyces hansenii CBS767]|uniref:DEHA2G12760p n=1 Tax=Debaryomyces hansenii (strain ATCC 36239 / CBS 767 / BCRC 21394 / JCM 1990 / NBRC 0083 / IGC 2968) TaxID=284592 RepID=Q6BI81_DEBHA|nr:DEHA2G12760p [Debaryomyces hansenii CBS767]CAG90576.1 DEHA2G12760p [Debaryomyces hansenii CBS767]|eukprot:XP_462090.1 DEHA2G12760p [Debaryomyces hansenii CBS767]
MFSISVRSIKEPPISRISVPDEKWQTVLAATTTIGSFLIEYSG